MNLNIVLSSGLVKPNCAIPEFITELTSITNEMCLNGDTLCLMNEELKVMNEIYQHSVMTAFNGLTFDFPIINRFKIKWKGIV